MSEPRLEFEGFDELDEQLRSMGVLGEGDSFKEFLSSSMGVVWRALQGDDLTDAGNIASRKVLKVLQNATVLVDERQLHLHKVSFKLLAVISGAFGPEQVRVQVTYMEPGDLVIRRTVWFVSVPEDEVEREVNCSGCGATVDAKDMACRYCGARVVSTGNFRIEETRVQ